MAVPTSLAIIVDYNDGLQISDGQWPRSVCSCGFAIESGGATCLSCGVYPVSFRLLMFVGHCCRLRQGVAAPEPLPWDMLMALALVDGLAGDGDSFWGPW